MWVPKGDGSGESTRTYPLYVINDLLKTFQVRATLIKKWNETGGVMILGFVPCYCSRSYTVLFDSWVCTLLLYSILHCTF